VDYETYISSDTWRIVRRLRLQLDKYTCQACYRKNDLEVHHLTYERLGSERLEDLITLCVRCHNDAEELKRYGEVTEKMTKKQVLITQEEWETAKTRY